MNFASLFMPALGFVKVSQEENVESLLKPLCRITPNRILRYLCLVSKVSLPKLRFRYSYQSASQNCR